jgi:hypothetical protein
VSRFTLGSFLATPGALRAMNGSSMWPYINRHASGDWGEVGAADKKENKLSIKEGFRIMSEQILFGSCKFF